MQFQIFFDKNKTNIDTIYDFCALCFEYLDANTGDFELFAGEYLTVHEESERANPNLDKQEKFQGKIFQFLKKELRGKKLFGEIVDQIVGWTGEASDNLTPYGDAKKNRLVPVYFLLLAMDRYLGVREVKVRLTSPMNQGYAKKVYVYLKPEPDIMQEAREQLGYGAYIEKREINSDLQHMTVVSKKLFPKRRNPLRIVPIRVDNNCLRMSEKKLKIAVIPFNGFQITDFKYKAGGLFEVRYTEEYHELYLKRALSLLEKAVEQGANIVLFPEYVCSPKIQEGVRDYLREKYRETSGQPGELLFVVAGTGWEKESSNNILRIYDRAGNELGAYYKFTKFRNDKGVENLRNPGKRSTIVYAEGIGMFMPAICRDISDGKEIEDLVRVFKPFCMLVPAWSPSMVRGFEKQFERLVAETYGCAVLCNACEPMVTNGTKRQRCGLFAVSAKKEDKSKIEGKCTYLVRERGCEKKCAKEGCVFLLDLDFSADNVRENQVLKSNKEQIKCPLWNC